MTESALATAAIWSYGIAAIAFAAFAIRLGLGWRSSARATLLVLATAASAGWALCGIAAARWPTPQTWLASNLGDALRYAAWFAFLASLFRSGLSVQAVSERQPHSTRGVPVWLLAIALTGAFASVVFSPEHPLFPPPVAGERLATFGIRIGLAIVGLMLVEQLWRRSEPQSRWAVKPLCIGLAGMLALDLFFFADGMLYGWFDPNFWVARGFASVFVIPFIAVATARNPGWTIDVHLSRGAVFHSTAILLSGAFLLAVAVAGYFVRFVGGDLGRALQIETLFAALLFGVFVATSGSFRSKLRVFISKHFFSYRFDYREEWLRFTRTLADASGRMNVQELTIKALADLVESPGGCLWLRDDHDVFRQAARWNMAAVEVAEPGDSSLSRFLERTRWVVDVAEYRTDRARYADLVLPDWLLSLSAGWLVIPLISGADLIGFAILATPRAAIAVNWEVRDLLKTASSQAASYLGQIRATEALLEARKFSAFNRMSAFVVHDLKNLVTQLSLLLKNAERHRANPEFQRDMLQTIEHVVGRMNNLMLQLRTGTAPVERPRLVDLASIVQRVCANKSAHRAPIPVDLEPGIAAVGHEDRLDHVIGHLVQNALDATATRGAVSVRLARDGQFAVLEVKDTGVGMSREFVRDRLFKPFETSKPAGMGIGVYESAQYLSSVGGRIFFESTLGEGTIVRVLLPADETAPTGAATARVAA